MLLNLSTLDFNLEVATQVLQAWSPEYRAWICVVDEKSPQAPANTIELTPDDIRQIVRLRCEGQSKEQALAAVGVLRAGPDTRI